MSSLKRFIDGGFPAASRGYRYWRDYARFRRLKPHQTSNGLHLYGDRLLEASNTSETDVFLRHVAAVDVVIDVGANVGYFSCLAARAGARVVAVEPNPLNLRNLYRNLLLNGVPQVEVFPVALSDRPNICPLFGGGQGATLVRGWGGIQSNYQTLAPVNTLDNVACDRFQGDRLLVKVDVEGNEFALLQGAARLLAKTPAPTWMIENGLTTNFGGASNPHFADVFRTFWDQGYEAVTVGGEPRPVTPDDVGRWVRQNAVDFGGINYLFVPGRP